MEFHKSHISKNKNVETTSIKGGGSFSGGGGLIGSFLPAVSTTEGVWIVNYPVRFKGSVTSEKEITAYVTGNTPSSGETSTSNLYELKDVKLTDLKDNQYIRFDAKSQKWVNVDGNAGGGGGGGATAVDWVDILNKPTEYNPAKHIHKCIDIEDISTEYTPKADFTGHTNNGDIHTTALEKKGWNDASSAISTHTLNGDIHTTAEDKIKWNTTSTNFGNHSGNTDIHITADERTKWTDGIDEFDLHKQDTNIHHTHSNKSTLDDVSAEKWKQVNDLITNIKLENGNIVVKTNLKGEQEITAYSAGGSTPTPTPASNLYELQDVNINKLTDKQVLQFDGVSQKWVNSTIELPKNIITWDEVQNKPTEFNPQAHQHTCNDITDIATEYTSMVNFKMHKGSTSLHTNADEKKKWDDASTLIDQHTGDQDAHCNFDLKEKWDTTSSEFDLHKADTTIHHTHSNKSTLDKLTPALYSKLTQLLDKIIILPNGDIKFKTNISSTGEITAFNA